MLWHPKEIQITESVPGSVSNYKITVESEAHEVIAEATYPIGGPVTTIPIGSNGLFDALTNMSIITLYVTELYGAEEGPKQGADNWVLQAIPDGAELIVVNY